jgi:hypothetical protein
MALGIILAPYGKIPGAWPTEVVGSRASRQSLLCPRDPYYNQRGEAGYYHDTQLGELPTDGELAVNRQYTPVASGWIATRQGSLPPAWNPTANQSNPFLPQGPLRDAGVDAVSAVQAAAAAALAEQQDHNKKAFTLAMFSTTAVVLSSLVALFRTARLMRDDRR